MSKIGYCRNCEQEIDEIYEDVEASGNGIYTLDENGEIQHEVFYEPETEEYSCPKCNYIFETKEEMEEALKSKPPVKEDDKDGENSTD